MAAPGVAARAQEARGPSPPEGALRAPVVRDPRLEPDAALLPMEWPALERLRRSFVGVRPLLEAVDVEGSAARIPLLDAAARGVAADSMPAPVAARAREVREIAGTVRASLARAAGLAPAAAEAARADSADRAAAPTAAAGDATPVAGAAAGADAGEAPAAVHAGAAADPAAGADSAAAVDPLQAYLRAWRDAERAAEDLLHLVRDPGRPRASAGAGGAPAPVSRAAPE